jgi:hypothetical protein
MIRQTRTGDTVLVKSREMTGRTQALQCWLGGKRGVKTTENKIHWPRCYILLSVFLIPLPPPIHTYVSTASSQCIFVCSMQVPLCLSVCLSVRLLGSSCIFHVTPAMFFCLFLCQSLLLPIVCLFIPVHKKALPKEKATSYRRKRATRRPVPRKRTSNYHYMAPFVYQLM